MNLLKRLTFVGIFLVPFIALIKIDSLAFPFVTSKAFIFRILIELLFGIWLIFIVIEKRYRPRFNWLLGAILAFLVVISLADIFGANPLKSIWGNFERMDGLIGLIHYIIYFLIASTMLDTERLWARLFNTTIGVSVILSLLGLIQLGGGMAINTDGGRLDSTLGNAAYFAIYLLIHIFLALFMFAQKVTINKDFGDKSKKGHYIYIAIAIFEIIILYFTATRSAMLGLVGGIFVMTILWVIYAKGHKKLHITAIIIITTLILMIGGFIVMRNHPFVTNNPILNRFNAISIKEIKKQTRYYIWSIAIQGIKENPILGSGQENFNLIFDKHYDPALYNAETYFDRVHNIILDWLTSGGILGLISYLCIFITSIYYIWSKRHNSWSVTEKSILISLIVGYFINNIFMFDNITSYILFFTILAYIYSQTKMTANIVGDGMVTNGAMIKHEERKNRKKERKEKTEKQDLVGILIIPTIAIVLSAIYFINWNELSAASLLKQAYTEKGILTPEGIEKFEKALERKSFGDEEIRRRIAIEATYAKLSPEFDEKSRKKFFTVALEEMNKQIETTPTDAYNLFLTGSLLYTYGRLDQALVVLEKAHQISPTRQDILSKIADVYIVKKDYEKAYDIAKESYTLEPRHQTAVMTYAIATIHTGDIEAASKILVDTFGTDIIYNYELMLAYEATNQIEKIIAIQKQRVADKPEDIQARISLSAGYLKIGQREKAIEVLEEAAKQDTSYASTIRTWIEQIKAGKKPQ